MKIALFGGRFDPIHNGHLAVAREVLKVHGAEKIWFSLENQHQWRPIVAPSNDRLAMLQLAVAGEKKFEIDQTPIALGGLTETIFVVREIRKKVSDDIIFVAGSDQLSNFYRWSHWRELQKEVQFLIVARAGTPIVDVPKNCIVIDDPNYEPLDDSATRIREFVKAKKSIHGLVPQKVEAYIYEKNLYA